MHMRLIVALTGLGLLSFAGACGPKAEPEKANPRTAEQQRMLDSTIGESAMPGARGVKGALAVSDSAAAKRRLADSIANNP